MKKFSFQLKKKKSMKMDIEYSGKKKKKTGLKNQETRVPGLALPQMSYEISSKSVRTPLHLCFLSQEIRIMPALFILYVVVVLKQNN